MSMLFDEVFYRKQTRLGLRATEEHFNTAGDAKGFDPTPYFSTSYYKARYPDWQAGGAQTAIEDMVNRMRRGEARQPHPLIDPAYYRETYPDLRSLNADAYFHFVKHGDHEQRSPSADFDAHFYANTYLLPEQPRPFLHYVTIGKALGYLPRPQIRSFDESRAASAAKTQGLKKPILILVHSAQATGVPILARDLALYFKAEGWDPVFFLMQAGPLLPFFEQIGPVFIGAEGWDPIGLRTGMPQMVPALITTAAAAHFGADLAAQGSPCVILIHEMAQYIHAQNLMPSLQDAQRAGATLIGSIPRQAAGLADALGALPTIQPGITLPQTTMQSFRDAQRQFGAAPMFIGAGTGEYRKGLDLFIDAARDITANLPDATFVWLGQLQQAGRIMVQQAQDDGIKLITPGFVSDSLAWYRAADAYLLTSRQDPGPTTVIQAAAVGTRFVGYAADIGLIGVADSLGTFITPGDQAGFVRAALAQAQANTPALRRATRKMVAQHTSFKTYGAAVLQRLTSRPASSAT
ncbi:glycosyltransferase [Ketogulonicigenium vulgare]|uniref:Glycosyl transferase family 2 n=1 Tax=Ketogulonicigenium vulgare (strain WSH-001) TaxID=759362 RepID=F9Y427_KETVW|nr:glycosyltransferase [Ketogulonicigenium vulgare]AEM41718.1 Glycosyl transferase family 2 [Ketogulonicigenium vulgare WSH-001]ALJ82408.1 glycosyl transferase [Ketogulonicigenium vulgare]ANW34482.1 glycosyl transferase [Ketogulonicigenium vulgare]